MNRVSDSPNRRLSVAHALGALALTGALAAIACSGGGDTTAPYQPPPECSSPGVLPGGTQAVVAIRGFAFSPDTLRAAPGTMVTWVNCETPDIDAHTATATGGEWDSGYLQPRAKYAKTFDVVGRFGYACLPHPFMRGAVIVQ
jgi:plastocyanin